MLFRTIRTSLLVLAAFLLLDQVYTYSTVSDRIVTFKATGARSSGVREVGPDSLLVWSVVDSTDFSGGPVPSVGDTVVALDGDSLTEELWSATFKPPKPPGTSAVLSYRHEGKILETTLTLREVSFRDLGMVLIYISLYGLTGLLMYILGTWTAFRSRESGAAHAFSLFALTFSASLSLGIASMMPDVYQHLHLPLQEPIFLVGAAIAALSNAAWLHLAMLFPSPLKWLKRHPILAFLVIYGVNLPFIFINGPSINSESLIAGRPDLETMLNMLVSWTQMAAGIIIFATRRKRVKSDIERRQISIVLMGAGFGFLIMLVGVALMLVIMRFGDLVKFLPILVVLSWVTAIGLIMIPLSFIYAFRKHRLLELEWRMRRNTRVLLLHSLLFIITAGVITALTLIVVRQLGEISLTLTLLVPVILALTFSPLIQRLRSLLDRWMFPERYQLQQTTEDFLGSTSRFPDRAALFEELENRLIQALRLRSVIAVLRSEEGQWLRPDGEPIPVSPDGSLLGTLEADRRPLMVDEIEANPDLELTSSDREWLNSEAISSILPMSVHGDLIGFVAISLPEEHDGLSAKNLGALLSIVGRVALESENLRLLEDSLEKRRMQEQLEVAREVQKGLMPRKLPETPGLEIDAVSQFCFEIAGDYYDVIAMPDGRTVVAVADVSGKGAGAALIMANIQASLRTALRSSTDLGKVVADINDILHKNTSPEEYITFFVAMINPAKATLSYVNAGHNPPLLISGKGEINELETGGPVIGVVEGVGYKQGRKQWKADSLLVAYTDGLTEAMNRVEEEYGPERLTATLLANLKKSPAEIRTILLDELSEFCEGVELGDDLTLLIARGLGSKKAKARPRK